MNNSYFLKASKIFEQLQDSVMADQCFDFEFKKDKDVLNPIIREKRADYLVR